MIILITGASHTGKTVLAQKMLEKYGYPYLSIDHLMMGLIRSGNTGLTPEDDNALTCVYKSGGEDAFLATKYKHYSKELNKQAVLDYLGGRGSLRQICQRYGIRAKSKLQNWIKKYAVYDFLAENSGSIKLICWVLFDQKTLEAYDNAIELLSKELKSNDGHNQVPMIGFYHQDEIYGCFSNWYPAEFDYAGRHYANSEQFMMYHKVSMFRKYGLAKQIMSTSNPMECKDIARQEYPEFKTETWESTCYTIVKRGVKAKFYQNPGIREILLNTGNAILAECSPIDKKWGIGLSLKDPDRKDCSKWNGRNMLGRILMEVREEIRQDMLLNPIAFNSKYKNLYKLTHPMEWESNAGALEKIPDFHAAIHAYADTLPTQKQREQFYNDCSLDEWESVINSNKDILPRAGFFEMKQEVFEIVRLRKRIESMLAIKYK